VVLVRPLALLLLLAFPSVAGADELADWCASHPQADRYDAGSVLLCAGETAHRHGQLLDVDLAIRLSQKAESCDARLAIELERAKRLAEADIVLERARTAAGKEENAHLRRLLLANEGRSFYEHPVVLVTGTAIIVVGLAYALAPVR
jgi:hypothetical protein